MDKMFLRLIPFAAVAVLAAVGACTSNFTVICYIAAVFALFIIDMAGDRFAAIGMNVLFLCTAALFGGASYVFLLALLAVSLAVVMACVIKVTADFGYTFAAGIADFSVCFMIIDMLSKMSDPSGGLFKMFGSTVDSIFAVVLKNINSLTDVSGYTAESIDFMRQYISAMADAVKLMLPGIIITAGGAVCIIVLIASRICIKGMPVPPLSGIRAPKVIVYAFCLLYIASGFISGSGTASFIVANAVLVLSCFMMLCGFSVVKYLTDKIKPKPVSVAVFIIFIPVCFAMSTILAFVGMADGIFKFRSLDNEKE